MSFGIWQLIIILLIILLLFGPGKLPKVMTELGKGLKSFKSAIQEEDKQGNDKKIEDKKDN